MKIRVSTLFVAFLLVSTELLRHADAHGWMVDPVPRSGGGSGTANASTGSPCGKAGPTTITAAYIQGANVSVSYMNANGHGQTGNTVTLTYVAKSGMSSYTAPTAADFTVGGTSGAIDLTAARKGLMDTTNNKPQSWVVTMPNTTGDGVLQFFWAATDGSKWYDCAYITLIAPGAGACADPTVCATNAQCTDVAGQAVCKCRVGFYGDGKTCTRSPDPIQVYVYTATKMPQDDFTVAIAGTLAIAPSRILYDTTTQVTGGFRASFYITSDENGTNPLDTATTLRAMVTRGDAAFADNFKTYQVVSMQIVGKDASPRAFGIAASSAPGRPVQIDLGFVAVFVAVLAVLVV